ncbi:MAG: hypothetical protein WCY02_01600 [Parvibaculum sp.]
MARIAGQTEPYMAAQDPKTESVEASLMQLTICLNGILTPVGLPATEHHAGIISHAMREYEQCHPGDSFESLVERARFSKEDKGLLRDWLAAFEHATDSHLRE